MHFSSFYLYKLRVPIVFLEAIERLQFERVLVPYLDAKLQRRSQRGFQSILKIELPVKIGSPPSC